MFAYEIRHFTRFCTKTDGFFPCFSVPLASTLIRSGAPPQRIASPARWAIPLFTPLHLDLYAILLQLHAISLAFYAILLQFHSTFTPFYSTFAPFGTIFTQPNLLNFFYQVGKYNAIVGNDGCTVRDFHCFMTILRLICDRFCDHFCDSCGWFWVYLMSRTAPLEGISPLPARMREHNRISIISIDKIR